MRHGEPVMEYRRMPATLRALMLASMLVPARVLSQGAEVTGAVVDSASGVGIALAEVVIDGRSARASTDEHGAFRLSAEALPFTVRVRRLGFEPRAVAVTAQLHSPMIVRLVPSQRYLDAVVVRAERTKYTGRLAGYYSRLEHRTQGVFITREDLEREKPTQLTDMLQRQPGVRITRGRPGAQSVRMRGRDCRPLVWLDGAPMSAGDVDLDSFAPTSLEGIELYLGASAPSGFQAARGQSECGTVLLWSRGTDTEPRRASSSTSPAELEELLASLSIFAADQVDTRAALEANGWSVPYPPSLRASGTSGRVVAEFVVDTLGRVEQSRVGIVSSTDPLFSAAVRESAASARFSPAIRGGRRVRQLVRLPFDFHPATDGS